MSIGFPFSSKFILMCPKLCISGNTRLCFVSYLLIEHNEFEFNINEFICSFRLRIECMLLKAEFEANLSFLEPSIESMLAAGQGKD